MEERKFVCKYCSKRFRCGKSLGGHIRTHMKEHSVEANEEKSNAAMLKFDAMRKKKRDSLGDGDGDDDGADGNLTYGLRENPKKTMRFVHSNATNNVQQQLDKFCKECGKGFSSLKALCGHMACHSEKEKQKLVMDSESDTETNSAPKRSKKMRFKNNINNNNNNNHLSSSLANGSSTVSEVEQEEQEEVARCLMMLSKDTTYYSGRFGLVAESSDNNSVVLEAKSPSFNTKFTTKNVKNSVSNAYEFVDKKLQKGTKLKSAEIGYDYDNSDSGYFSYGPKKIDSADSNGGFYRTEVKSSKLVDMSGFEDYDVELNKEFSRGRSINTAFKKLVSEDLENGRDDIATRRSDSKKRLIYDSLGSKKATDGFNNDEIYPHGRKGWEYESLNTEIQNDYEDDSAYESDENSSDSDCDSYPAAKSHKIKALNGKKSSKGKNKKKKLKSKKMKEHECPICNRIFKSGQALGGHKRSHFVGGSEENTFVIRPADAPPPPCLIDLNQPAPVDE